MSISVCIVTFNGESFIERQLKSILSQTHLPDEIILLDDFSDDNTVKIAKKMLQNSGLNFIILKNIYRLGINRSFEKCFSKATSEIIVISDQDDFWFKDRLLNIKNNFKKNPSIELISLNAFIEVSGIVSKKTVNDHYPYTSSTLINLAKNRFTGCQIAIKRNFLETLYPFPKDFICYYDHWISQFSLIRKTTMYIDAVQGYYCRHSKNVTNLVTKSSLVKIFILRSILLSLVIKKYIVLKYKSKF